MTADELTSNEKEVVDLLRANDPAAAERLVALNDTERARVLGHLARVTAPDSPSTDPDGAPSEMVDETSEHPTVDEASEPPVTAEIPQPPEHPTVDEASEPPVTAEIPQPPEHPTVDEASEPPVTAEIPQPSKYLLGINRVLRGKAAKIVPPVIGVVVLVGLALGVRACGGDSSASNSMLLVRHSSDDLYIAEAGQEVTRANRVDRDVFGIHTIRTTTGDTSRRERIVALGERELVVARTESGEAAWVIDGTDHERIIDSDIGSISVVVVDGILYIKEESEESQRCYRGTPDDLERASRGDYCEISRSGHVLIANQSDDSYTVRVESPSGDELLRAGFPSLPEISDNGLFLVALDEEGVTVTHVESGDRVWKLDGGTGYELASHRGGSLAVAAHAPTGELVLVLLDNEGNADELAELEAGSLAAEFNESGHLFWIEFGAGEDSLLFAWDSSEQDIIELADEEGLRLIGIYQDSAVTATEDDFGVLFQRFPLDGSDRELHEFEDNSGLQSVHIEDDYLYAVGGEMAAVVPLGNGEAFDSEFWDRIILLDYDDGTLVAAGVDGSSEVLFSTSAGTDRGVEFGQYDEITSAQVYGDTLYATIVDGADVDTLAFDFSSGDERDDESNYEGYRLVNTRGLTARDYIFTSARQDRQSETEDGDVVQEEPTTGQEPTADYAATAAVYVAYYSADLLGQGEARRTGRISSTSEVDQFVFALSESSDSAGEPFFVETTGSMDTVIEIYSLSGDDSSLEYTDDDSGEGSNASLQVWLEPGWYLVTVGGYLDWIGDYEVYFYVP